MSKFPSLSAGDEVYVVPQKRGPCKAGYYKVIKIGRKYGYVEIDTGDLPFHLDSGKSAHSDPNMRHNGFGFDVYASETEYQEILFNQWQYEKLAERLWSPRGKINSLDPETVNFMHHALNGVTPRFLKDLARWFDDPSKSPTIAVTPPPKATPGMLLRQIADAWEELKEEPDETPSTEN